MRRQTGVNEDLPSQEALSGHHGVSAAFANATQSVDRASNHRANKNRPAFGAGRLCSE
jgi:hypothetical protein